MIKANITFTLSKIFAFVALVLSFIVALVIKDGTVFVNGLFASAAVIGTKTITADWIVREKAKKDGSTLD